MRQRQVVKKTGDSGKASGWRKSTVSILLGNLRKLVEEETSERADRTLWRTGSRFMVGGGGEMDLLFLEDWSVSRIGYQMSTPESQ